MLYVVPTPIGNLGDITLRAMDCLREADFIIAENPAHTAKLLQLLELPKKELVQFAEHNERTVLPKLLSRLSEQVACLVTDAGTPAISDPGFRLVRACRENNIPLVALPGPSALITALSGSGLPTDKFLFVGFLPKTEPKVMGLLQEAKDTASTLVGYESPQRILKTLPLIARFSASAKVVVARELTKLHETYHHGTATEVMEELSTLPKVKGEITLVISLK